MMLEEEQLLSAYALSLAKRKNLLLGKVAPYDLSGDLPFMEMASRHNSTQYRGETNDRIMEEDESRQSGLAHESAYKHDTIHL